MSESETVWDRLETLPERELKLLVEAAVSVLWEQVGEPSEDSPAGLPPRALRSELAEAGVDPAVAQRIVTDGAMARPVGFVVLRQVATQPALAAQVEEAYLARRELLVVETGVILAVALLVAALKLKRVRVGRDGVEVDFYQLRADVLSKLRGLLGG